MTPAMQSQSAQPEENERPQPTVDFSLYRNPPTQNKGASFPIRALWHVVNALFLQNPLNPSSKLKIGLLRLFGGKVGRGVIIKPGVNIKSPWRTEIGDYSMIGENAWLDSLTWIKIGRNVCISQGAYLCTGNHDWTDRAFALTEWTIVVEDGAWIGARANVLPGAYIATHSVIAAGSTISKRTEPYTIYAGNPAQPIKRRVIKPE
jgi:putative colanic acid biosynthesis acetyltransferase WcaF